MHTRATAIARRQLVNSIRQFVNSSIRKFVNSSIGKSLQSTDSPVLLPHDFPSVVRVILINRACVLFGLRDGFATTSTVSPILKASLSMPWRANCAAVARSITHCFVELSASSTSTYRNECGARNVTCTIFPLIVICLLTSYVPPKEWCAYTGRHERAETRTASAKDRRLISSP